MHEFKRCFPAPPADWPRHKLSDIADRITKRNDAGNVNVLTISAEHGLISQREFFSRRVASDSLAGYYLLERGDFAYNKSYSSGYPLGAFRRLDRYESGCVSPLYICSRPKANAVNPDFLIYYIDGGAIDASLAEIAKEGVRNHGLLNVSAADFFSLEVPLPPPSEQRLVAAILSAVDSEIDRTQAIIEKLKQVKQGLLHDLLTRGIDANGDLRECKSEAPGLYKESTAGTVPAHWAVQPLGEIIEHLMDYRGRTPKKLGMEWGGGDILALSANNVQMGAIDRSREANLGSQRLYDRWMSNGDTKKGDILLTLEAPLGNVAQIPDDNKYILSQRVILIRMDTEKAEDDFAFWQFIDERFQNAMTQRSTGTTATGIQRARLVRIPFVIPPLEEQKEIVDRLSAMQSRLAAEETILRKLKKQRTGLAEDLLTGRVRVTPLLDPAPAA